MAERAEEYKASSSLEGLNLHWTKHEEDLEEATPSYKDESSHEAVEKMPSNGILSLVRRKSLSGRPREETQNGRGIGILSRTTGTKQFTETEQFIETKTKLKHNNLLKKQQFTEKKQQFT